MTHMLYSRGRLVDNALYVNSAVSMKGEPPLTKAIFFICPLTFTIHPPCLLLVADVSGRPSPAPLHPARARSSQTEQISEKCAERYTRIDRSRPTYIHGPRGRCRASTLHTNREFSTLYPLLRPPPHTSSIISIEVGRSGEARRGSVGGLQVHVIAEAA